MAARWWGGVLAAGVAVLLVGGCGFGSGAHDIKGSVIIASGEHEPVGELATPSAPSPGAPGDFARYRGGVPVVPRDGDSGQELAATILGSGVVAGAGGCVPRFTLEDVPDADLYRISIGEEQGVGTPHSKVHLEEDDWQVFYRVGG